MIYYQSEKYYSLSKNAYVGGDAYNYIINANYFTGYICLGGTLYICSTILICMGMLLVKLDKEIGTDTSDKEDIEMEDVDVEEEIEELVSEEEINN